MKRTLHLTLAILFAPHTVNSQWDLSAFVSTTSLYEVEFPRLDAAYVIGDLGVLHKSTDAGITWSVLHQFGPFSSLQDLQFMNADTGFVGSTLFKQRTIDGGLTWTPIGDNMKFDIIGETLYTSTATDDTTRILRSTDLGDTWVTLFEHAHPGGSPYLISFIDGSNAYFIERDELENLYATTDGFATVDSTIGTVGDMVPQDEFHFNDVDHGYFYGSWGALSQPAWTWWGGILFAPLDLDGFEVLPVLDMTFNTPGLYACSLYGKIFRSMNHGSAWVQQPTPVSAPILSIAFADDLHGIAVTPDTVLYTSNGGAVGTHEQHIRGSSVRVVPNPACNTAAIEGISDDEVLDMTLTDMQGRNAMVLDKAARTIDVTLLPAGTYLLMVRTISASFTMPLVVEHDR